MMASQTHLFPVQLPAADPTAARTLFRYLRRQAEWVAGRVEQDAVAIGRWLIGGSYGS